jgi:hypothetical protein
VGLDVEVRGRVSAIWDSLAWSDLLAADSAADELHG